MSFAYLFFFVAFGYWSLSSSNPAFPNAATPLIFYSNQTGTDLQLLFCRAIAQAKKSIFLEMYAITDPTLIQLIEAKAKRGVSVTILTDHKASPTIRKKLPETVHLVSHKGRGLMHRKTLVIDHQTTLLGSVNFTTASLTLHDNFALAFFDATIADFF